MASVHDCPAMGRGRLGTLARVGSTLLLCVVGVVPLAAVARSASPLSAAGTVTGELRQGALLSIRLVVRHTGGWQEISEIQVGLELRGKTLEQLVVDPTHYSATIPAVAGPAVLGQHAELKGTFFRVDPGQIGLSAKGPTLTLGVPITVAADPPPGARLTYLARGFDLSQVGPRFLTPPVATDRGFSWGTLALAIVGALFVGSFMGNLFASRRRPAPRPSIYAAVQRRVEEERAKG
jgi:hypothetical protein